MSLKYEPESADGEQVLAVERAHLRQDAHLGPDPCGLVLTHTHFSDLMWDGRWGRRAANTAVLCCGYVIKSMGDEAAFSADGKPILAVKRAHLRQDAHLGPEPGPANPQTPPRSYI